jgi:squalene-associated FAD-dependent desaturase
MNTDPVIVVGAGWSGLAAAAKLASHGIPVTLLESARQPGGRARRVAFAGHGVDNGQHILLGAYHYTLELIDLLGLSINELFQRQPLHLHMQSPGQEPVDIRTVAGLPAPFHLGWGIWKAGGLTARERRHALGFSLRMTLAGFKLKRDIPVADLLRQHGQPQRVIETLWEPLCLAALNTPIDRASAQIYLNTLKRSFLFQRGDSDVLFPLQDLGKIIPDPAMQYIEDHYGHVCLSQRVLELNSAQDRITGVSTVNDTYEAPDVILATQHTASQRLLDATGMADNRINHQLTIATAPICTIYLQYDKSVCLPMPFIGMCGTTSQWLFDRSLCGQPGILAVVISAEGPHMKLDNDDLVRCVISEIADMFPDWPAPSDSMVIREKRATFCSEIDVETRRPGFITPLEGLWLAGDIVANGLPATLEGAVYNGMECARRIIEKRAV